MRKVCEKTQDGAQKKGGKVTNHCGVQFPCNVSCVLLSPPDRCPLAPERARSDGLGVRCVQLLVKLCLQTKEGEKWEKRGMEKASQWRRYWRVFFCLSLWHWWDVCQHLDCGPGECHVSHRWALRIWRDVMYRWPVQSLQTNGQNLLTTEIRLINVLLQNKEIRSVKYLNMANYTETDCDEDHILY